MILPNLRLGLRHKSRKHARPSGGAKKGRKEKCHHCGECGPIHVLGLLLCSKAAHGAALKERTIGWRRRARSRAHELFA